MSRVRARRALLLPAGLALAGLAFAGGRDFWRFETGGDFLSGESEGVSVGPEARVRLAPALRPLHDSEQPFVWAVASDGSGGVVAGGSGADGLLRAGGGEPRRLADTGESAVHAAAVGADGSVYFAASPGGSLQRVSPGGERAVLAETEARYVWAIVPEPGGGVLVATGMPGAVLRVGATGEVATVFSAREENVTALHRGADGVLHAGVEPSGIVFRIGADGDAMALYDTPQAEIRGLAVNAAGEVFAAAVAEGEGGDAAGAAAARPPEAPPAAAGVTTTVSFRAFAGAAAAAAAAAAGRSGRGSGGGNGGAKNALYRIAPNGAATAIWESNEDRPLALAMQRDERLLLGTGDRGRLYRVSRDGDAALVLRVDSEQVTAAVADGETVFLGASNPGRVLALGPGPRTEGRYRSRVLDAGGAARFGRIEWEARTPPGTAVAVETRAGNSEEPDDTWSDWAAAESGASVASPAARFLQWRAVLRSDGMASPELTGLTAAYLPENLAPRVASITLHPPGRVFEEMLNPSAPRLQGMEGQPETTQAQRENGGAGASFGGGRRLFRPGIRTATFEAADPNGDRLRYRVSVRLAGEVEWRVLRSGLRERVVAWDTSAMADGRYELRVEAGDAPDNPPDEALTGTRVSRPFVVDNTPPTISGLTVGGDGSVRFTATDAGSPIRRADVSVDGGEAQVLRPLDGIADSLTEEYGGVIPDFPAGAATVVVRVEDDPGNRAAGEAAVGR